MSIPIPEKRIADFENRGFGMFIHWGLYSQMAKGEWAMNLYKIPRPEYEKLMTTFTAKNFDAGKIARLAKRAGMKYITLTTRHHDGFSLYDTCGLSDYDAPHSPAGRDLIREFVDACNAEGISPMFYHTTLDWHVDSFNDNFPEYLQYLRDSVEVLCSNYGKIGGLWFDGNWSKKDADWEEDKLYEVIRRHQPEAIIVNNTGLDARGAPGNLQLDSVTFEQGRPEPMNREGMSKYFAAEMCHTMNDHWGCGNADFNYKSLPELIETLCACRKVGANYLLNIGPDGDGGVMQMQEALLCGIGDWIRVTGDAFYEAKPCEAKGENKDFILKKGNKLYAYIHGLTIQGDSSVTVETANLGWKNFTGIGGKIKSVKWTDNGEALDFKQDGSNASIFATGFEYGTQLVVRVAEIETE